MDPLVLALVVIGAVAAAGVGLMIRSLWRAPLGYQDRDGFHFGNPRAMARKRSAARATRPALRAVKPVRRRRDGTAHAA